MLRRFPPGPLLALFGALLVAGVWIVTPGEETKIRRRLTSLAAELNSSPGPGLELAARARGLSSYFAPDVTFHAEGSVPVLGRDRLVAAASRVDLPAEGVTLSAEDLVVTLHQADEASVALTAVLSRESTATGGPLREARPLALDLKKIDSQWRISAVTALTPLSP